MTILRRCDSLCCCVDVLNFASCDVDVGISMEDLPNRRGYFTRGENAGCYLIQQRLENVGIVSVDDCDVDIFVGKAFCRENPAEAGADDNDAVLRIVGSGGVVVRFFGGHRSPSVGYIVLDQGSRKSGTTHQCMSDHTVCNQSHYSVRRKCGNCRVHTRS